MYFFPSGFFHFSVIILSYPCFCMCQEFIPFYWGGYRHSIGIGIEFYSTGITSHPFPCWWTLGWAMTNKAAINIHEQVAMCPLSFLFHKYVVVWLGHRIGICLTFSDTSDLLSSSMWVCYFSSLLAIVIVFITLSHSNRHAVEFHCGLDLRFPND